MNLDRRRFVSGVGAAGALGLFGGGGARRVAAQASPPAGTPVGAGNGELNLYSSRHYDTDQQLYDGFTAATGTRVNLIEAEADELIERIKAEGANTPADVLLTVDAGRLWRAQEEGLLQPIASAVLEERVPENLREPGSHWFGLSSRVRVLAHSRERVDPEELSTYEALADETWRERLLVRSSSHVYNQSLVGALIDALGAEATGAWAEGVVANFARPPQGGDTDQYLAIAAGEGDVAIVNHYYYLRLLNSADAAEREAAEQIALFFPNQGDGERGVHVNISGGGVVATAPNPVAAVAFLEYLTSDEAQMIFARGNFEYPVVAGIEPDPSLAELGEFRIDPLNASVYGANNEEALLAMLRAGWE